MTCPSLNSWNTVAVQHAKLKTHRSFRVNSGQSYSSQHPTTQQQKRRFPTEGLQRATGHLTHGNRKDFNPSLLMLPVLLLGPFYGFPSWVLLLTPWKNRVAPSWLRMCYSRVGRFKVFQVRCGTSIIWFDFAQTNVRCGWGEAAAFGCLTGDPGKPISFHPLLETKTEHSFTSQMCWTR